MRCEIIDGFLTTEECKSIIDMARPRLIPSYTWSVADGMSTHSDYRISEQMFFSIGENYIIKNIEQRIAELSGLPIENGEGTQIVHYLEGGYYKEHWDYFDPAYDGNKPALDRGGQRIITVIMYLNNMQSGEGGETFFPRINMSIEPKEGVAIIWHNLDKHGQIDQSTFHEAMPVLKGEKWIATKWLREGRFI